MKIFEADIRIDAPPSAVFTVLKDAAGYPSFDPSCERIEGTVALGGKLAVYSKLAPGRAFRVKVTALEPDRHMEWTGGMPLGLFKGVRTFTLEPAGQGTHFRLREAFSGPMLRLIGGSLPDLTEAFRGFCSGLKAKVERRPGR